MRRPWGILIVLTLPVFIGALDLTIVSAILPEIINQLKLPIDSRFDDASWAVSGYLLAYTISMTFMGRISDIIGRRWVYIACLIIFMFGSWFVTIAHTWPADWYLDGYRWLYPNPDTHIPPALEIRQLHMIILGRVIQAFGAGAMVPVTMAVVGDMFPAGERARPLGFVGAVDTAGWVLGHLYGGAMVKFFGAHGDIIVDALGSVGLDLGYPTWHTLFILNIPISLVALVGAWYALRGGEFGHRSGQYFDVLGTALITLALIGFSVGVGGASPESALGAESFEDLSTHSSNDYTIPLLIGAAVFFGLFLLWEMRTRHPLIDLKLFRKRNYSASAFTNFCVGFGLAIGLVSVPLVINIRAESTSQEAFQDAALIAGLVLSGLTVPMALAAYPGALLSDRYGFRPVTVGGLALAVIGFVLCSLTWTSDISPWIMAFEIAVIGVGLGLTISPVSTALINEVPMGERGVSAALVLILRLVGMTLAISGLTSYALSRVEQRTRALGNITDIDERQAAYLDATVAQINELFLIGAAVTVVALFIALRLHGGRVEKGAESDHPRPTLT
ncbi:MAG: MFS transporter [Anaerolineales bacterium]|nr:MFS transporter [Anaerolineales bacterium]